LHAADFARDALAENLGGLETRPFRGAELNLELRFVALGQEAFGTTFMSGTTEASVASEATTATQR
jgi:hypothetical protein